MDEFQKIYKDNYKSVFYYLYRLCDNQSMAEDLTQDTFYRMLAHICQREEVCITKRWLIKIAHHVFIDYVRKNNINTEDIGLYENSLRQTSADPAGRLEIHNIQQILRRLPVRYRSIILLKDYYGFSYEEMADILKCSISVVKVTLYRARERFREVYEKDEQS